EEVAGAAADLEDAGPTRDVEARERGHGAVIARVPLSPGLDLASVVVEERLEGGQVLVQRGRRPLASDGPNPALRRERLSPRHDRTGTTPPHASGRPRSGSALGIRRPAWRV